MNDRPQDRPDFDKFTPRNRVDVICDAFEKKWRSGHESEIEEFLTETEEPERTTLFGELLSLELEYRRNRGEAPDASRPE